MATIGSAPDQKCSRCGATGHLAAACKLPFQRSLCSFCGRLGHVASSCAAKLKADRAQRKVEREAQREEEQQAREKEKRKEQDLIRQATVWCWHCGGQGHVKADCSKLFKLKLERARAAATAAKDDDACSDSTVATATDRVLPGQKGKGRQLASRISGCHYCGAEGHTARECKERLITKERSSAFRAQSFDIDTDKRCAAVTATATVHVKFEPEEMDFPELSAAARPKDPMPRRVQCKGVLVAEHALVPNMADCELNGMD